MKGRIIQMKRPIALILLVSILSAASCGTTENEPITETSADTTTTETTAALSDDLPERDFEGYTFRMFIRNLDQYIDEMYIEETTGDIMDDAIYERNTKIAERFNINYEINLAADVMGTDATNTIMAGDDAYDILVCHARQTFDYAHKGLLLEWNTELPYIDLDKPWWNQDARENLSICHKLYTCAGDICYLNLGAANAMFYNKQLMNELGIGNIYETVLNGDWTFDKFSEYVLMGSRDLNGDTLIDIENDRFGYVTGHWIGPMQVLYTGGQRILTKNDDDELVLSLNTERTIDIYDAFFTLIDSDPCYIQLDENMEPIYNSFSENRALFVDMNIKDVEKLRDMNADFGIIPWPKFDESEDKYYTNVDADCSLIGVPITNSDPERTSIIIEALAAEGYQSVIPQYYEVALQTKYARDDESVQMIDLIRAGQVFDVGYYYSHNEFISEFNSIGRNLAHEEGHNFSSYYAANEAKALAKIAELNELYSE